MSLSELESQLCERIAGLRETLLGELAEHVAIPTGRNHHPGLLNYRKTVQQRLEAIGGTSRLVLTDQRPLWMWPQTHAASEPVEADVVPETLIVQGPEAGQRLPRVLIAGHLDTVHDPHGSFQSLATSADGLTVVGPGAVDMKGGILIAVTALETLHALGVHLAWTFLLNNDEETGSFGSEAAIREQARVHDVGIALEPALPGGKLVVQRMGSGQFKIEVFGRSAHVGREFTRGVSAVTHLAQILQRLAAMADPEHGLVVNVGPIVGGEATNVVPDHAACWGNVRYDNPETAAAFRQAVEAFATPADAMPRVVVHTHTNRPVKPATEPVMALAKFVQDVATDVGQPMEFASTGGVCDGNLLQDEGLVTLDTLGVRGGNLHREDEFVEVASLVERAQMLAIVLARLAEGHWTPPARIATHP